MSYRPVLLALASLARDRTSAIVGLAEPALRARASSGNLNRAALRAPTLPTLEREALLPRAVASASIASAAPRSGSRSAAPVAETPRAALLETDPPSQAYADTPADTPAPVTTIAPLGFSKMHQTSSRLLRMTSDDRPFTRVSEAPDGRGGDRIYMHT